MLAFVVVAFALESLMMVRTTRRTLEAMVQENLESRTDNVLWQADRFVSDRCDEVQSWSALSLMDEVLLRDRYLNIENLVLRAAREAPATYQSVSVLDRERRVIASSDLQRLGQTWPAPLEEMRSVPGSLTRLGPFPRLGAGEPRLFEVAHPIVSSVNPEPIGWVVAEVRWQPIETIVRSAPIGGRPQDGSRFLLLLDDSGRALAGAPQFLRLLPGELRAGDGLSPAIFGPHRSRSAGKYLVMASGTGPGARTPGTRTQIVALWRTQDAFARVPVVLAVLLGSAGLGLVLAGAGFIGFSRGLARRLMRLEEGTERLARGELSARVDDRRDDEVGRLARSFNTMASEIERTHDSLQSAVARWQGLVATAPDFIYTIDRDGTILFVNRVLSVFEPDRVIGTRITDYVPEAFHAALRAALERVFTERTPQSLDVEGVGVSDTTWYSVRLGPVERDGAVIAATLIATDITARKRLEREIVEVSELERARIGRDLHDGVGQVLTGIGLLSKGLERRLGGRGRVATDVRRIKDLVTAALEQTRGMSRGLVPIEDGPGGLLLALEDLAASVERNARVVCELRVNGEADGLDPSRATHLFRIAQEAVSNSLRHGQAKTITLSLERDASGGRLTVEDDGLGLPPDFSLRVGMGLRSMRYRAGAIGATLSVTQRVGGGVVVSCHYQ